MDQRSDFILQFLERLGAPLSSAVIEVTPQDGTNETTGQEARQMALLLTKAVELSVSITSKMDINDAQGQTDALRLALAALVSPLIAHKYKTGNKTPDDSDIQAIAQTLDAALAFSDNFDPAADNTIRLENMTPGTPGDNAQIAIQYVHALIPVINSIATFSFGLPEQKLAQDVAGRLTQKAKTMLADMDIPTNTAQQTKRAELALFNTLCTIYASCHQAETTRLSTTNNREETPPSLDSVWKAFDIRAKMLEVLAQSSIPISSSTVTQPVAIQEKPLPSEAPAQPVPPETPTQPVQPETPAQPVQGEAPYNPMSFFKPAKESDGTQEEGN